VTGEESLLAIGVDHDVDCAGHDYVEVVRGIPFAKQVLADGYRLTGSERIERAELGVVELREGDSVVVQGSSARARHRALGKLDPGPDVHIDDDGDDLEDLLWAEVLGERIVESLERRGPLGVGYAGELLGVAERRLLGVGVKLGLPPRGQGVDLGPGDTRLPRCDVVQVEAVGAVVELRNSQV
jgi:hypothetical protein